MHLRRFLCLSLLGLSLAGPAAAAPRDLGAEELYELGLRQMRRGNFTRALETFQRVRNYHRDDPVSVMAQLAIGDVYFKKGDYEQARFTYEEFAAYHPRHEDLDYVTYRIGLSIYKRAARLAGRDQTATRGAVNVWTGFDTRFPDSEYRQEVTDLLERSRNRLAAKEYYIAQFYARRDAWGAVRGRAEELVRRYPDTPYTDEALALLARSLHRWGRVDEARDVADRLREEYPDSRELKKVERWLAKPPGEQPDEKVFIRPYRVRGMNPQTGAPM